MFPRREGDNIRSAPRAVLAREAWLRAYLVHGEHCQWNRRAKLSVRAANDEEQVMRSLADQRARDDDGILLAYLVAIEKDERKIVPLGKQ